VRVEFKMPSTGIAYLPGLARPIVIDGADLAPADAAELERLIDAANFFALPAVVGRSGGRDMRQYTIVVDTGEQRKTVQITEPVDDPTLQALLAFLQSKVRARPGG
jgi:hypothetical protein